MKYDNRRTAAQRGYGHKWRKYRAEYLAEHPWCAMHLQQGQRVPATVVDHIKPHRGDQDLFWATDNHQPLCKHCHDSHKHRQELGGGVVGCDANGIPLDRQHHWRRGGR